MRHSWNRSEILSTNRRKGPNWYPYNTAQYDNTANIDDTLLLFLLFFIIVIVDDNDYYIGISYCLIKLWISQIVVV
jgi:hypothetical protein